MAALLLAFVAVILSPFLTHYLSTHIFYRTTRSPASGKIPPTIPYWLPGIWPGISIIRDGLSTFVSNTIKQYGNFAPFVLKAGPYSFVVIRDPNQIRRVFEAECMTPKALHGRLFDTVYGFPVESLRAKSLSQRSKAPGNMNLLHSVIPREYCSGPALRVMTEKYVSSLRRSLADKMIQEKTWTEIEDLWSFFQLEITRAIIEAMFGSSILTKYRRIVRDFWKFDSNIEALAQGLPRYVNPGSYKARDDLIENLAKWLDQDQKSALSTGSENQDSYWDADKGSRFFQEIDSALSSMDIRSSEARAAAVLAIIHWSNSMMMPATFWSILETLRNPALMKHLSTEMGRHYDPHRGQCESAELTSIPVFQSMHMEVTRLRTSTCSIRVNEGELFPLDGDWSIRKGTEVRMFSHDLALNAKLWAEARPSTVEKPLQHFWPERFITPTQNAKQKKGDIRTGTYSLEGISSLLTSFGGGQHPCPGRFLAKAIQASTLAVLLTEYEIQLSDVEFTEHLLPSGVAYGGPIKPLGPVRMRIRKRVISKTRNPQ